MRSSKVFVSIKFCRALHGVFLWMTRLVLHEFPSRCRLALLSYSSQFPGVGSFSLAHRLANWQKANQSTSGFRQIYSTAVKVHRHYPALKWFFVAIALCDAATSALLVCFGGHSRFLWLPERNPNKHSAHCQYPRWLLVELVDPTIQPGAFLHDGSHNLDHQYCPGGRNPRRSRSRALGLLIRDWLGDRYRLEMDLRSHAVCCNSAARSECGILGRVCLLSAVFDMVTASGF